MAEPVLAEFWRVDNRALRGPSTQMRWAREMAITFLRREPPGNAPGFSPPSRLRTLPVHVVHQCLHRIHPHWSHEPRSCILHCDCDRWHIIICMSVPNTDILCSSQSVEEAPAGISLLYRSLQTRVLMDPSGVEQESPAVPSPPISTDDGLAWRRTDSTT